jgi:hypothetical protein
MSEGWTDPTSLEGDALTQWYLQSPADIEQGRQAAAARRYRDFFYGNAGADPDAALGGGVPPFGQDIDPGFSIPGPSKDIDPGFAVPGPSGEIDPGFTWAQVGPNRWSGVRTDQQSTSPSFPATGFDNNAASTDGALRSNVGYGSAASTPSAYDSLRQGSAATTPSQQPPIDPSKTPVFQTGPDGKLHPIPGWHTTGPFDFGTWSHNIRWGGVAKDLGEIGAGVASFFSGAGLGGELLSALGPEAETAVAEGIAESPAAKAATQAFHDHHPEPMYMGGSPDQERVRILDELHRRFHSMLGKAHREAGFPPVGGRSGSGVKWSKHYELNPGSRDDAFEILRRVSREFDETYGTNISSKLPRTPGGTDVGPPPPN